MLKNNLKEQWKESEFVKWQSLGKLGYSIITTIIAAVAGIFFNIDAYLPMYLGIAFAVIGLIISIIYSEPHVERKAEEISKVSLGKIMRKRVMILIFFMNLITVGTYTFLHIKSTLLLQIVCEDAGLALARISLIVSGAVLASRIVRVIANLVMPIIYKKTKKKPRLIMGISATVLFSGVLLAIGGNIKTNVVVNIILITLALFIVISVRDLYGTLEDKIVVASLNENEQRQALMLARLYGNFGRLLLNGVTLLVLGITTLNVVYLYLLIFAVGQMFISFPLSKYLTDKKDVDSEKREEVEK